MLQLDEREMVRADNATQDAPRVLLVQSDPDLRDALTPACEQAGLQVHDCATIALAQEACRQHRINLIVVDWVVEGFFADEVLKLFEATLHPQSLPTTLVLSRMGETDTRDCLRPDSPIHGILTRPTDSEEFAAWAPKFVAVLKRCQRSRERTMHV
jgi:DNA-binding response OmpR family regulator